VTARGVAAALALLCLSACAARQADHPPLPVHLLAVLPLQDGPQVAKGVTPQEDGAAIVTAQLYRVLAEQTEIRFAPDLTIVDTLATPELRATRSQLDTAVALGKAVGADAVVVGTVTRFSPRVGTAYGASQGASVAFELGLVSVASGEQIWSADFEDTQEALATNFLDFWMFWSAGARWLTANELAGLGVEKLWPELESQLDPQ
jgi:hypothetical protein